MSTSRPPGKIALPFRRSFGQHPTPTDPSEPAEGGSATNTPRRGRLSFSANRFRGQDPDASLNLNVNADEGAVPTSPGRAPIPSALHAAGEVYSTPLPSLSMIVLSITMLGEFLSANVSTPFLLFMVRGFGEFEDEAQAAYMTGVLVSMFFLTQFVTSLLWATVADRYGQRAVLTVSLFGTACTCVIFGTATTFREAVAIRLMQGVFAGAIGVARGCVSFITDSSNEGRAYAILGFCWGFGGVSGAIVGGSFESPAKKWPGVFAGTVFETYPYLLPTAVASSVTMAGAFLSLFLGPDGGPRQGAIALPEKVNGHNATIQEDDSAPPSPTLEGHSPRKHGMYGSLRKKVSGYFAKPGAEAEAEAEAAQSVPLAVPPPRATSVARSRADSSAYGYGPGASFRNRLNSTATVRAGSSLAQTLMRRRGSGVRGSFAAGGSFSGDAGDLNFAQRLVLANENAVTNIADLWVAAAMNADNEEVFEDDEEDESMLEQLGVDEEALETPDSARSTPAKPRAGSSSTPNRGRESRVLAKRPSNLGLGFRNHRLSSVAGRRPSSVRFSPAMGDEEQVFGTPLLGGARRMSTASHVPAIFAHTGLRTPPAGFEERFQHLGSPAVQAQEEEALESIMESRVHSRVPTAGGAEATERVEEKAPGMASMLPLMIIAQYGLLALHNTTHDQVFYSYLVSDYEAGGLNLNPGHFSQLIALMSLMQIVFQFYFYPNIGPPRGRFSHLAMFRLGSLLFIPSYLSVILYRAFASENSEGNLLVMAGLAVSTSVRYCGSTFGYTAISILLNYMSPPQVVGFANGIAQSAVSLARFVGPIAGGWLWSYSVDGNPGGYPLGFLVCSGVCAFAIASSFFIR